MKKPYTQFNLPRNYYTGAPQYVPARARSGAEIERRRARPTGTLVAEQQLRGACVAEDLLRSAKDEASRAFLVQMLPPVLLVTAERNLPARDVMAHTLRDTVPQHGRVAFGLRGPTTDDVIGQGCEALVAVSDNTGDILEMITYDAPPTQLAARKYDLAHLMVGAALRVAAIPLGDKQAGRSDARRQTCVRTEGIQALHRSRALGMELGCLPTLAQLVDPNSSLATFIRQEAPDGVYTAFDRSAQAYNMPV